jgi:hypothetical protein
MIQIEKQDVLIRKFERGLLTADGQRIKVTLMVKPGECAEIRSVMRDGNWKPAAGTKKTVFRPDEWVYEYYEPMTQSEADRAGTQREAAYRRETFEITGMTPEQLEVHLALPDPNRGALDALIASARRRR